MVIVVVQSLSHVWLFETPWMHHARFPHPSQSPRVCSNSCPLSQGCHPAISSSVISFSSCLQSSPPSGSFPVSWLFASGGHSIGASASTSVLPMNILGWFPLGLTGLILCPRDSQESSLAPQFESVNSSMLSLLYGPTLTSIHDYWKNHSFDYTSLCWGSDVSAFEYAARFVIAFLPRSKHLLISWLQPPSALILEPKKIGILQARILEWVATPFFSGSPQPKDRTWVSCMADGFFTIRAIREASFNDLIGQNCLSHWFVRQILPSPISLGTQKRSPLALIFRKHVGSAIWTWK